MCRVGYRNKVQLILIVAVQCVSFSLFLILALCVFFCGATPPYLVMLQFFLPSKQRNSWIGCIGQLYGMCWFFKLKKTQLKVNWVFSIRRIDLNHLLNWPFNPKLQLLKFDTAIITWKFFILISLVVRANC